MLDHKVLQNLLLILCDSYITDVRSIKFIVEHMKKHVGEDGGIPEGMEGLVNAAQELSTDAAKSLTGISEVRKVMTSDQWSEVILNFPGIRSLEADVDRFQALEAMAEAEVLPEDNHPAFPFGEEV